MLHIRNALYFYLSTIDWMLQINADRFTVNFCVDYNFHFCYHVSANCLLQHLSTSPEQEPPHFESCMRAALSVIANNPEPLKSLFLYGNPHRFSMDRSSGQWIQL